METAPTQKKITRAAVMRPRTCLTCSVGFESRSSKKIYCDACMKDRNREADRLRASKKLRQAGAREVGSLTTCVRCGATYELKVGSQRYCDACSSDRFNRWHREKRVKDAQRNISERISRGINSSLSGAKGKRAWPSLVGYDAVQLMQHLERQFPKGMTWENRRLWHVDHIVPLSSFNFTTTEDPDFKAAWALTNLRPIWARDNLRKKAKRLFLL